MITRQLQIATLLVIAALGIGVSIGQAEKPDTAASNTVAPVSLSPPPPAPSSPPPETPVSMLFSKFISGDDGMTMIDNMPGNEYTGCDGSVWAFDWNGKYNFKLGGGGSDTDTSGKYTFDGTTLHLYDMRQTRDNYDDKGPQLVAIIPDIDYKVVKLTSGRIRIGKTTYRHCADVGQ